MSHTDLWEITDDNGTIFSGTSEEIDIHWNDILYEDNPNNIKWEGDLRLIQVYDTYR